MLYLSIIVIMFLLGVVYYFYKDSNKTIVNPSANVDVPVVPTVNEEQLKQSQLDALATAQKAKEQVTGMIEQINAVLQDAPVQAETPQPVVEPKTDSKPKKKRKYYPKKK